jgi:predicted flap endonuclease-1-like 5' DNA nuclease
MSHYLIELLVYVALAYLVGCLVGLLFKRLFGITPERQVAQPAPLVARPAPVAAPALAPAAAPRPVHTPAPAAPSMAKPKGIAAARGGKADDLQRISGVGPKNETILHNLGFFHFDQIAAWTAQEVAWVDDHLRFGGRIQREEWIRQAGLLAAGKEDQFMKEFGTGGLKGKDGQTHSGSHTRKS